MIADGRKTTLEVLINTNEKPLLRTPVRLVYDQIGDNIGICDEHGVIWRLPARDVIDFIKKNVKKT